MEQSTADRVVLAGGLVLGPDGPVAGDVAVSGGTIIEIGSSLEVGPATEVVDCTGCWIGPGFVDLHTHLREPGQTWKEDVATGSAAAAAGGYTALLAMANTTPALDTPALVEEVERRGADVGLVEIKAAGTVTRGRAGESLADLEALASAGVRWFSDDGDSVPTAEMLREAMVRLVPFGGVISEHAEDAALTVDAHMHEGEVSRLLSITGMPGEAETRVVARDIALAGETGGRVHIQHVSTAATVELVSAAKGQEAPITAEVTPHHLTFDHTDLKDLDSRFKMKPPLRTAEDVAAVRDALASGVIDVVATDHAPHAAHEDMDAPFREAAFGVIGLETAAAAVNTAVSLTPAEFFDRMSVAPARLGGFSDHGRWPAPGAPANLVVFDPDARWVPRRFLSKSANSPFLGRPLVGQVRATVYRGSVTFAAGRP